MSPSPKFSPGKSSLIRSPVIPKRVTRLQKKLEKENETAKLRELYQKSRFPGGVHPFTRNRKLKIKESLQQHPIVVKNRRHYLDQMKGEWSHFQQKKKDEDGQKRHVTQEELDVHQVQSGSGQAQPEKSHGYVSWDSDEFHFLFADPIIEGDLDRRFSFEALSPELMTADESNALSAAGGGHDGGGSNPLIPPQAGLEEEVEANKPTNDEIGSKNISRTSSSSSITSIARHGIEQEEQNDDDSEDVNCVVNLPNKKNGGRTIDEITHVSLNTSQTGSSEGIQDIIDNNNSRLLPLSSNPCTSPSANGNNQVDAKPVSDDEDVSAIGKKKNHFVITGGSVPFRPDSDVEEAAAKDAKLTTSVTKTDENEKVGNDERTIMNNAIQQKQNRDVRKEDDSKDREEDDDNHVAVSITDAVEPPSPTVARNLTDSCLSLTREKSAGPSQSAKGGKEGCAAMTIGSNVGPTDEESNVAKVATSPTGDVVRVPIATRTGSRNSQRTAEFGKVRVESEAAAGWHIATLLESLEGKKKNDNVLIRWDWSWGSQQEVLFQNITSIENGESSRRSRRTKRSSAKTNQLKDGDSSGTNGKDDRIDEITVDDSRSTRGKGNEGKVRNDDRQSHQRKHRTVARKEPAELPYGSDDDDVQFVAIRNKKDRDGCDHPASDEEDTDKQNATITDEMNDGGDTNLFHNGDLALHHPEGEFENIVSILNRDDTPLTCEVVWPEADPPRFLAVYEHELSYLPSDSKVKMDDVVLFVDRDGKIVVEDAETETKTRCMPSEVCDDEEGNGLTGGHDDDSTNNDDDEGRTASSSASKLKESSWAEKKQDATNERDGTGILSKIDEKGETVYNEVASAGSDKVISVEIPAASEVSDNDGRDKAIGRYRDSNSGKDSHTDLQSDIVPTVSGGDNDDEALFLDFNSYRRQSNGGSAGDDAIII